LCTQFPSNPIGIIALNRKLVALSTYLKKGAVTWPIMHILKLL